MKHASKACSAFTLVEVMLALAVMAIGLLGVLVLFPVGLNATRTASDSTEMSTIAEEYISKYQQAALNSGNYINGGTNQQLLSAGPPDSILIITNDVGGPYYTAHITVRNTGFSQINTSGVFTNTISRVTIELWRPGAATNTFVTEVARYALP